MSDIRIQIQNYKLIKDYDEVHRNARILLVTGKNEIGKSSLIRAFIENITAKSQTDDPVTHGQLAGSKTFTWPDKNGNDITVVHEFSNTNKKGTFYCIDHEGRKIKEVNKIREIIGMFEELSIDTFYTLRQSAPGRKRIIENYFYKLLEPAELMRIEYIDKETSKGGELYDLRTGINQDISYYSNMVDSTRPAKDDELLAAEYENMMSEITKLEEKQLKQSETAALSGHMFQKIKELEEKIDSFAAQYKEVQDETNRFIENKLEDIAEYKRKIGEAEEAIENAKYRMNTKRESIHQEEIKAVQALKNFREEKEKMPEVENFDEQLKELRTFRDQAFEAKGKIEKYNNAKAVLKEKQLEAITVENQIAELREEKKKVLSNSKLPSGLSIDGDDFTWNGFDFADSQISKSSALLVIAEILCNIVESKIVYLGEKALFDKDRFKQLVKIAEKYGKIPVLEQVVDEQTELKVITEVEDV